MKLLTCPMNGPRNVSEFQYLGPCRPGPDPNTTSDADWAAHLFGAPPPGEALTEWWRHTPSNTVFLAERDPITGAVARTWLPEGAE